MPCREMSYDHLPLWNFSSMGGTILYTLASTSFREMLDAMTGGYADTSTGVDLSMIQEFSRNEEMKPEFKQSLEAFQCSIEKLPSLAMMMMMAA